MESRLPRLLLAHEVDSEADPDHQMLPGAGARSAFVIDERYALTAEHCIWQTPEGPWVLRLPADPVTGATAVCVPVRVVDADRNIDVALLARVPQEEPTVEDAAERLFREFAMALGGPVVRDTPVGMSGILSGNLPDGVALSGMVVAPEVSVVTARAMQLFVNEFAAAAPDDPKGASGSAVVVSTANGESVIGLVRSYAPAEGIPATARPAGPNRASALGGKAFATRIDDIARRFPVVADLLAVTAARDLARPGASQVAGRRSSLATLLRADAERTAFVGRETEIRDLRAWCSSDDARAARLVTGRAGQGKTRLARRLCALMVDDGWVAVVMRGSGEPEALDLGILRAAQTGRPLLLVVDYAAEYGARELRAVLRRLGDTARPTPSVWRMLLIARNVGDWWSGSTGFPSALGAAGVAVRPEPLRLAGLTAAGDDRDRFFRTVRDALRPDVARFADQHELAVAADPVMPPLDHTDYGAPLMIHIAAVCSLLPAAAATGDEFQPEHVIDRLLDLERDHHWLYAADYELSAETKTAFRDVAEGPAGARRVEDVVAAATLFGAADRYTAARLVEAALGNQARLIDVGAVADWLRDLYPPVSGSEVPSHIAPLQPDLLGEELVLRVLNRQRADGLPEPERMPYAVLRNGVDQAQARRLLTVLLRLSERRPEAAALVSGRVHDRDGKARGVVAYIPVHFDLSPVEAAVPTHSATLVHAAARLCDHELARTRVLLGEDRDPFRADADATDVKGIQEAMAQIRRAPPELAAAHARNYMRYAARVLDVGYIDVAVDLADKAHRILGELIVDDRYAPDFAEALLTLALALDRFGVEANAALYADEAVQTYQRLASAGQLSLADRARLAQARSAIAATRGSPHAAADHAHDAVVTYRRLVHSDSDDFLPLLASALDTLTDRCSWVGRSADAEEAATEAHGIHRTLAGPWSGKNTLGLAGAVFRLARSQAESGEHEAALELCTEGAELLASVDLCELTSGPLAANIAIRAAHSLRALGRTQEALASAEYAVTLGRRLFQLDRVAYQIPLARALRATARCALDMSGPSAALDAAQESANHFRVVYRKNETLLLLPDVARACVLAAKLHDQLGGKDAAARHVLAAAEYWAKANRLAPGLFADDIAATRDLAERIDQRPAPAPEGGLRRWTRKVAESVRTEVRLSMATPRRLRGQVDRRAREQGTEMPDRDRDYRELPWNRDDAVTDIKV
ncbi:hypothetical protein [Streptomyces sp. NPDC058985]|uniref:hypothetical protein n=1 Tax=Streptomyces sp. NPDC058985 TaxID=3346684 RepID=UPI0036835F64